MSIGQLILIITGGLLFLAFFWELVALAVNYRWYWREFRCRLEPWTFEFRRKVKRWWWVVLIQASLFVAFLLALLLFPPFTLPIWAKIALMAVGVFVVAFYSWLLLHLGGFAISIWNKIKGVNNG